MEHKGFHASNESSPNPDQSILGPDLESGLVIDQSHSGEQEKVEKLDNLVDIRPLGQGELPRQSSCVAIKDDGGPDRYMTGNISEAEFKSRSTVPSQERNPEPTIGAASKPRLGPQTGPQATMDSHHSPYKPDNHLSIKQRVKRFFQFFQCLTPNDITNSTFVSPAANLDGFKNALYEQRKFISPRIIYPDKQDPNLVTVNLASLHQANLHSIRQELIYQAINFVYGDQDVYTASDWVHLYKVALEDWNYIKACALKGQKDDPFLVTSKVVQDSLCIREAITQWEYNQVHYRVPGPETAEPGSESSPPSEVSGSPLPDDLSSLRPRTPNSPILGVPSPTDSQRSFTFPENIMPPNTIPPDVISIEKLRELCNNHESSRSVIREMLGGSRNEGNKREAVHALLQRIGMACTGGAFLIGPMLIMVLHKSQLTTLLTTSVCVFVFGLIMALQLHDPFNVLSATAAYAAVLVVFVGSSSQ